MPLHWLKTIMFVSCREYMQKRCTYTLVPCTCTDYRELALCFVNPNPLLCCNTGVRH